MATVCLCHTLRAGSLSHVLLISASWPMRGLRALDICLRGRKTMPLCRRGVPLGTAHNGHRRASSGADVQHTSALLELTIVCGSTAQLGGKPDLIIGNYSDGNLVSSLLSHHLNTTQCTIAHALEKTKYPVRALGWQGDMAAPHACLACRLSRRFARTVCHHLQAEDVGSRRTRTSSGRSWMTSTTLAASSPPT